ncbi:hypothetical protein AHMF7605_22855 [Adhaeribacter arboris]|uniref:Uncharacterized protein n=1 Tax=Adhaeribacter arboris TaxID=2072846 RepID=A0A2T2YKX3_9BACT|nr:hypothetical protein AHMF7605_22855 [Adhaeribacter arboris]
MSSLKFKVNSILIGKFLVGSFCEGVASIALEPGSMVKDFKIKTPPKKIKLLTLTRLLSAPVAIVK